MSKSDPWTAIKYNPVDTSMNTRGSLNIISGYSLSQNRGRTVVVHHNGTKVGCGVLGNSLTSGGAAEVAAAASGGGNCPGGFTALIEPYPGYTPADGSMSMASGVVTVGQVDRHTVSISYQLSGLVVGESGGLHIHTGLTCDTASEVGGHYWNEAVEADDPWTAALGAVFSTAVQGVVSGLASGTSSGTFELKSGYSLINNAGHAVVVHNAAGDRIGCGILASRADDPGFASLAEAALAFASQKTNTAALIDSPQEVLTFALSLGGAFVLAMLLGVFLGRRCERNANNGGGGGAGGGRSNDMSRRKSSKRLDESAVAIEMSRAPDPGPKPKRFSLTAGIANPLETGAAPLPAGPPTPRTQNALPTGWIEQVRGTHGKVYFYNTRTGESLWERPTSDA